MSLMLSAGTRYIPKLRASCNLEACGVGTFAPRIEQRRYNHDSGKIEHVIEPLFTNYIFARFKSAIVSKIRFTRGVRNVVSFAGLAIPIDDEIIYLIQSRMEHGFVKLDADLKRGDEAVSYQACAEVEELQVSKVN